MKLANGYLVKQIEDKYVVIPAGQNVIEGKGPAFINESYYEILKKLENNTSIDELVEKLQADYEVEESVIKEAINYLTQMGYIIQ